MLIWNPDTKREEELSHCANSDPKWYHKDYMDMFEDSWR